MADEDAEAELIFEQWNLDENGIDSPADLQQTLTNQMSDLNIEIIDFLLHWEDEDDEEASRDFRKRDPSKNNFQQLKETADLLNALTVIDKELGTVDDWLGVQIERLSGIQVELQQIESENSVLEASWHNLSTLKHLASYLVKALSLTKEEEDLLRYPNRLVDKVLHNQNLDDCEEELTSLLIASERLIEGLLMRGSEADQIIISDQQWNQLLSMVAVSQQRLKFLSLAESFCHSIVQSAPNIFKGILKHKTFTDTNNPTSINIKHFNFQTILPPLLENPNLLNNTNNTLINPIKDSDNALLVLQRNFHSILNCFIPLIDNLFNLLPYTPSVEAILINNNNSNNISTNILQLAYIESTKQYLYTPILKQFFKHLFALTQFKLYQSVTLAILPKFKLNSNLNLISHFTHQDTPTALAPWTALQLAYMFCEPLIKREETFLESFLFSSEEDDPPPPLTEEEEDPRPLLRETNDLSDTSNNDSTLNNNNNNNNDKVEGVIKDLSIELSRKAAIDNIFQVIDTSFRSMVSTGNHLQGVEAVALLRTIDILTGTTETIDSKSNRNRLHSISSISSTTPLTPPPPPLTDTPTSNPPNTTSNTLQYTAKLALESNEVRESISSSFMTNLLGRQLRQELKHSLVEFVTAQVSWMRSLRIDHKHAGVLAPVSRLVVLMDYTEILTGKLPQTPEYVDDMYVRLLREIFTWILDVASQNEKYSDVIKLYNFDFFRKSVRLRNYPTYCLFGYLAEADEYYEQAEEKYAAWMIDYEFPKQSELSRRIHTLVDRVGREELVLYIRRQDVLAVCQSLEVRSLEVSVTALRKRLEKHFALPEAQELSFVPHLWEVFRLKFEAMVTSLNDVALSVYQIPAKIDLDTFTSIFDKFLSHSC